MTAKAKSAAGIMAAIMEAVGSLPKDGYNKHFKYEYTTAESAIAAVRAELIEHGVYVDRDAALSGATSTDRGTVIYDWVGELVFPDETRVTMCGSGEGKDSGDKGVMKAETAAFKYALAGTFFISWGDDPEDDRNDASVAPKKAAAKKAPAKKRSTTKATTKKAPAKKATKSAAALEDKVYQAAAKRLRAAETSEAFEAVRDKIEASSKLSDEQKDALDALANKIEKGND